MFLVVLRQLEQKWQSQKKKNGSRAPALHMELSTGASVSQNRGKSRGILGFDKLCQKRKQRQRTFPDSSAGTGTEGRAGGEGAGAHAEARAKRRGNIAEEFAAAGAAAVAAEGSGDIGTEPMAADFTSRIDALHREAGQVLHFFSLRSRKAQVDSSATGWRSRLKKFRAPLGG